MCSAFSVVADDCHANSILISLVAEYCKWCRPPSPSRSMTKFLITLLTYFLSTEQEVTNLLTINLLKSILLTITLTGELILTLASIAVRVLAALLV